MGHYLTSGRSSSWETGADLGAVTIFHQGLEKMAFHLSFTSGAGEKFLGVTPEMVSVLVQQ